LTAPDGAFTVGGGDFSFGQSYTESTIRSLFQPPVPNSANAVDLLGQQLSKMPLEVLQFFKDIIPDPVEEAFETIDGAIEQILANLHDNPLTKVVQDIQDTIDGLVNGFVGWVNTGYTPAQLADIAKEVSKTVSDLKTVITALLSQAGYAGTAVVVDFAALDDASTLGSNFSQSASGTGASTVQRLGGRAKVVGTGTGRWGWARYSAAGTKTDYQKIGVVFGTRPSIDLIGGSKSKNTIHGRYSADGNSYIAVIFTANGWTLGCQNAGSWTTFHNRVTTLFDPWDFKPGAVYWLECGTLGGPRIIRLWENNKILWTHVDTAAVSVLPSAQTHPEDYSYTGFGSQQFSDDMKPAEVASFAFYDNNPAALLGCGWRIARTGTGTDNVGSGDRTFPASWFDTIDYATSDLEVTISSNQVKVPATGWYQITVKQHGDGIIFGSLAVQPALLVNGSVVSRGHNSAWVNYNFGFFGTFTVYLNENDLVKPGYWASSSATSQLGGGDSAGANTWWSGVFLGNNKKPPVTS